MKRHPGLMLFTAAVLVAITFVGCGGDNRNGQNNRNGNSNRSTATTNMDNSNSGSVLGISREDFDRNVEQIKEQAKNVGAKVGSGAEDLWLWTRVRGGLATASDLRDSTIKVDVDNNVVTLTGSVSNESQKSRAEQIARAVSGVAIVKNELSVAPGGDGANTNRR